MASFLQPNQRLAARLVSKTWHHAVDMALCDANSTVLNQHCRTNCFDAIRFVIQKGCAVKYEDYLKCVTHPSDDPITIEWLLTHGASKYIRSNTVEGYLTAVHMGKIQVVDHIITNWPAVRCTSGEDLMLACSNGDLEIAARILSIDNIIETSNGDVIYYTCKLGRLEALKWLVNNGIDLDRWGPFGVETACYYNHRDLAFYLFTQGVSPFECSLWEYEQSSDTICWLQNQGVTPANSPSGNPRA